MSDGQWREHVSGPMLGPAQLCARCGEVLWVHPHGFDYSIRLPEHWPPGRRVASDGRGARLISGWSHPRCEPYRPQVGDRLRPSP